MLHISVYKPGRTNHQRYFIGEARERRQKDHLSSSPSTRLPLLFQKFPVAETFDDHRQAGHGKQPREGFV